MVKRCKATNANGQPCSATVPPGSEYCYWHQPGRERERQEARRRGGRNRSDRARARRSFDGDVLTMSETQGLLSHALHAVIGGEMEPNRATAAAAVARALLSVTEATETERRLDELEALVQALRRVG